MERLKKLQADLTRIRDSGFVSLGAIERHAGVKRGWCRRFIGGDLMKMRPAAVDVAVVITAVAEMRRRVCRHD